MSEQQKNGIVEWGRSEAARANDLMDRLEDARCTVRRRYEERLSAARGLQRLAIWLRMRREIQLAERRAEAEVAPREGLYLLPR